MPFVPVPGVAEFQLRTTMAGQSCMNTLYFRRVGSWDGPSLAAAAESLYAWWDDVLSASIASAVTLREVYGFDLASATGPTGTYASATPAAGKLNQAVLPNNVAITVSFRTARRGRAYRGRNYFMGLSEDSVVASTVNEAVLSAIVGAYLDLAGDEAYIPGATWVVCHRYEGRTPMAEGTYEPVTDVLIVDPIVDSQRRRLPGRGA